MDKYIKLLRENLIIVIPAVLVLITIIGFITFGFLEPNTTVVASQTNLIEDQTTLQKAFLEEYYKEDYDQSNPHFVLDPYEVSPLSGLLMFETLEQKSFFVVIEGKTDEGDLVFQTESTTVHRIPIYGLYANYKNQITLYENVDGVMGDLVSVTFTYTEELPNEISDQVLINTTSEYFQDDIMIMIPEDDSYPVGYDYEGEVRWYLELELKNEPLLLENGRLLLSSDKLISDSYYTTGLYEIDYLGKVYKEYLIPGGYHHSATLLPSGNFLVLTNDFNETKEDYIVEIDRVTGRIVNTFDVAEILYYEQGQNAFWEENNPLQINSISFVAESREILISSKSLDAVISIDYYSSDINYILGDPTNWSEWYVNNKFYEAEPGVEWQYAQSNVVPTTNGVFIFDNGVNKSKIEENYISIENTYSRGVLYTLNHDNRTVSQTYQFGEERGTSFYSPYLGNVQFLGENHYLIHSGANNDNPKSTVVETLNDVQVYELVSSNRFYYALHTSLYTETTSYSQTEGKTLGSLAKTDTYNKTLELEFNFFETVPLRYNLSFQKESERLVVNGTFQSTDVVYLILEKDEVETIYFIPSKSDIDSSTVINLVLFNGDNTTYYINETDLSGTYEIYLVVNDTLYNTYKHVDFD